MKYDGATNDCCDGRYENANSREYLESLVQQTREMLRKVGHSPSVQMTDTGATSGDSDLDQPQSSRRNKWNKVQEEEIETNK